MNEALVLSIVIAVLWLVVVFLRVPAIVLLSSILIGKLLTDELTNETQGLISNIGVTINSHTLQVILLILPVILTIIFLKGSTPRSLTLFNAVPLFFCLVTLGLFINPYFDVVGRLDSQQQVILTDNQSYIVALAGIITLISVWIPHIRKSGKHGKHKH